MDLRSKRELVESINQVSDILTDSDVDEIALILRNAMMRTNVDISLCHFIMLGGEYFKCEKCGHSLFKSEEDVDLGLVEVCRNCEAYYTDK